MWSVSGLLALSAVECPPVILWSTTKWLLFQWRTQGKGCSVISLLSARSFSNATGRPWYLATIRKQVGPQSMWSGCW